MEGARTEIRALGSACRCGELHEEWVNKKEKKAKARGRGERRGPGAAAIKEVKFVPEKMLIPPLCEQLIGRLVVRARRLRFLDSPGLARGSVTGLTVSVAVALSRAGMGAGKRCGGGSYRAKLVVGAENLRQYLAQLASFRNAGAEQRYFINSQA